MQDPQVAISSEQLPRAQEVMHRMMARLRAAIVGRDDVIELISIALFADGHVLLEDYPGSGKTTLARALGQGISRAERSSAFGAFRRIQFTPDLLPSDITGASVFDPERSSLSFRPGPLFAHVVLADEINRTSPKVQSAMLEAMAEKQVTVDNQTYPLDELFFVIATQNPRDVAGTYPLPTPQLDRFLFCIRMKHISREAELRVLARYPETSLQTAARLAQVSREEILAVRKLLRESVFVSPAIQEGLVELATTLRSDARVVQGVSTRSLVLMLPALQARALVHGRDFVSPDDVAVLSPFVFAHRLDCVPGIGDESQVVSECLQPVLEMLARTTLKR
ncbi:MAG: AAA family ATPase [Myxococcales bacterium]|nr:MAG: AAA family ATPase [Myxococcales bacterium]